MFQFPRSSVSLAILCTTTALGGLSGCRSETVTGLDGGMAGYGGEAGASALVPDGQGVGQDCSDDNPCREGLSCESNLCEPSGETPLGQPCVVGAECDEAQCVLGVCTKPGEAEADQACSLDSDCVAGLRCGFVGLSGRCQPAGSGDFRADCEGTADCFQGLVCTDQTCTLPTLTAPFGGTTFAGVECPDTSGETSRAYFEVPGAEGAAEGDFFRLPFPNDALLKSNGHLDLEGYPTPGVGMLGFDPVGIYVDALERDAKGFGPYPTVIFRFSKNIDSDSLREDNRVNFVDITPDAPEYGNSVGWSWSYTANTITYVCGPRLHIQRPEGSPLMPGHVYAVYLLAGLEDSDGDEVQSSDNMQSVLSDRTPNDSVLSRVHENYAPLRAYLAEQGLVASDILVATQITVEDVRQPMQELADTIESMPAPTARDFVLCDGQAESPCPQADEEEGRACGEPSDDYDEYHALVSLPVFQEGTAPYLESGGGIVADPASAATEEVCLSLTVPKGEMPEAGWPLAVYAHGTGGSFRSHVRPEVAGLLAQASLPDGTSMPMAVVGIDQVVHGTRRGASTEDPDVLFFNFANPDAARGNPLQGAADQLSLVRWASELDVTVDEREIRVNPEAVVFYGHSQGSTQGGLMLAYADGYRGAVLSGHGASLRESLLSKTSPVDIPSVLPFVFNDPELGTDGAIFHPVLALLQQWIDPADPLNFARALASDPIEPHPAHHIFQTYGKGDTYSPAATLRAAIVAGGLDLVDNPSVTLEEVGGRDPVDPPLSGNLNTMTAGFREYDPAEDRDGHFVAVDDARARADVARFLAMAAHGDVPEIGH